MVGKSTSLAAYKFFRMRTTARRGSSSVSLIQESQERKRWVSVLRGGTLEFDHDVGDFLPFQTSPKILCILARPTPQNNLFLDCRIIFLVRGLAVVAQPGITLITNADFGAC